MIQSLLMEALNERRMSDEQFRGLNRIFRRIRAGGCPPGD